MLTHLASITMCLQVSLSFFTHDASAMDPAASGTPVASVSLKRILPPQFHWHSSGDFSHWCCLQLHL